MAQMTLSHCDCCGQAVDLMQFEFCPNCQYPVNPKREQDFLELALHDLQRVARYGGASLRVLDLVRRYEGRLQFLMTLPPSQIVSKAVSSEQPHPAPEDLSGASTFTVPEVEQPAAALPVAALLPVVARSAAVVPESALVQPVVPALAMPVQPAASLRGFSLSGDAMVNVLAAVGGFLVLAGVLGTVFVTPSLWLAFLMVLGVHSAFGAASLITRRSALLRAVSPLYTIIFALLVPLLAFSAYRLVEHNLVALSVPYLLTLSALYAAVIYGVLAVAQRFVPFAYLGSVALLIGDLALAQALNLAYWWWPSLALLLALLALVALSRPTGPDLFAERFAILRAPLLVLMYTVIAGAALLAPFLLLISLVQDSVTSTPLVSVEPRLALLVLSCLFVLWYALWLWRTRQVRRTPLLAYLCLAPFLLLGYVLRLDLTGYVLLEAGVALLYHAVVRAARGRLAAYGFPEYTLDGLALGLIVLVMLQVAANLPLRLIFTAFAEAPVSGRGALLVRLFMPFQFTPGASNTLHLFALSVCLLITLDMTFARAGFSKKPLKAAWCWLLVLGGLLLCALYGLEVLLWQVLPLWALLALSLGLLFSAVLTRRFVHPTWAYPLEVLTLLVIAFTLFLSLSQPRDTISGFLLGFAALLYLVPLYQRRPRPSLFSAALLLLALVSLLNHNIVVLFLSLFLPLLAGGLCRTGLFESKEPEPMALFAWTLLVPGLFYGLWLAGIDMSNGQSVFAGWSGAHLFPTPASAYWLGAHITVAYEIAALGMAWYVAALFGRARLWLVPATLFWLLVLVQPGSTFWEQGLLAPALAVLGLVVEKRSKVTWALPFYLPALGSVVVLCGFATGQTMGVSWFLLGYALLAYGIGVVSKHRAVFSLTLLCSTLAVYLAASLAGNLYLPPSVALVGAGLGVVAGRIASHYRRPALRYAWPFYASALSAALLTGVYGALGDLSRPFYGAVPDALFLYALVASMVAWIERRASWNWLVAVFACWGVLLTQRLTAWYVLGAGTALMLAGLLSEQLIRRALLAREAAQLASFASARLAQPASRKLVWPPSAPTRASWLWHWPWYCAFIVATLVLGSWSATTGQALAVTPVVPGMALFTLLALVVMLVRRAPELLVFPVGLASWATYLWQSTAGPVPLIVAYTLLCALIYAAQFVWRLWPALPSKKQASSLYAVFSSGGLCLVLLFAVSQGALAPTAGALAQAGVLALVTLSVLLFLHGLLYPAQVRRALSELLDEALIEARVASARILRHGCYYSVGMLLSLAAAWELLAFGQTRFDTLTLVPASYLIVIAPLLLRDQTLPRRHFVGQRVALLGAALLLLPALWFSFQGSDLFPTLILLGEALLLLLLGLLLRMRIFILSSAALIIVGTLRMLFIAMPPSVPILLVVFGGLLMALATVLILSRHRLQAAWSHWE